MQIARAIAAHVSSRGVAVVIQARHECLSARGGRNEHRNCIAGGKCFFERFVEQLFAMLALE